MKFWFRRNMEPVGWILLTAGVVAIFCFLVGCLIGNSDSDKDLATIKGAADFRGLVKVSLFMLLPAAVTLLLRRIFKIPKVKNFRAYRVGIKILPDSNSKRSLPN